jgi:hypothetical protein
MLDQRDRVEGSALLVVVEIAEHGCYQAVTGHLGSFCANIRVGFDQEICQYVEFAEFRSKNELLVDQLMCGSGEGGSYIVAIVL